MKTRNFGGMSRSSGVNRGMIVRVTLAGFAVVGSVVLSWLLMMGGHALGARAAGVSTIQTSGTPLGEALDGKGNLWVAESKGTSGYIGEFNISGTPTKIAETAVSSAPAFLALDSAGNVWFTEPSADAIGELTTAGTLLPVITTPTKGSAPTGLTFDSKGNIWFTEQKGNKIGFLNVATRQIVETPLTQQAANPYGIINVKGEIWFTESSQPILGHFHASTTGTITTFQSVATSTAPHMLAADSSGNIWYTEGTNNAIGEYNAATRKTQDFSVASALCSSGSITGAAAALTSPTPGTSNPTKTLKSTKTSNQPTATTGSPTTVGTAAPTTCKNTFVAGIAIDSSNQVWFDESQTGHVGVFSPFTGKAVAVSATNNPSDGLVVDTAGNVWAASKSSGFIVKVPTGTLSSGAPSTGPVNSKWYFAEGRVGRGFREYLTIDNPTANACAVNIQYLYTMDGSSTPSTKTASVNISAATRWTESVNNDLGLADSSTTGASLAAMVTAASSCAGVVAERPMYFSNFHVNGGSAVSSGTDVVGATTLSTTYYFADVPSGSSNSGSYTSYITILNPNTTTANVTVNYYANGSKVQSQTLAVPPTSRGTIPPGAVTMPEHVAAVVTSDQPIMVERPTYFTGVNHISGAYDVVGAPKAASDWLFAEGYTGTGFQEYLTIANLDPANTASVTVTLKSGSGATNSTNLSVGPQSQMIWNVNSANTFSGSTPEVSAEVTTASSGSVASVVRAAQTPTPAAQTPTPAAQTPTPTTNKNKPTAKPTGTASPTPTPGASGIVVQRELYFTYKHTLPQTATGGTDVMGAIGPLSHSAYNFAEGYTNTGYNTWLTIQNPTTSAETIYVTIVNGMGKSSQQKYPVPANSRFTLDMTAQTQQAFVPGTVSAANTISTTVQTLDGSVFVAERPLYWNTSGISPFVTVGGSDVIGYC